MENLKEQIIESLKEVYDPEIPVNVYDLGLIYDINIEGNLVRITMSLTSPTCPTAEYIQEMISSAVSAVPGVGEVEIELTFEPRWTPDRVSSEAKEELGIGTENQSDVAINKVFGDSLNTKKENICKKCLIRDDKVPLVKATFKSDEILLCLKCLNNF